MRFEVFRNLWGRWRRSRVLTAQQRVQLNFKWKCWESSETHVGKVSKISAPNASNSKSKHSKCNKTKWDVAKDHLQSDGPAVIECYWPKVTAPTARFQRTNSSLFKLKQWKIMHKVTTAIAPGVQTLPSNHFDVGCNHHSSMQFKPEKVNCNSWARVDAANVNMIWW